MMPKIVLPGDSALSLHASSLRKFRGIRLPGSEYWFAEGEGFALHFQEFTHPAFRISYRIFDPTDSFSLIVHEDPTLVRFDAILEGSVIIQNADGPSLFRAGQYRITQDDKTPVDVTGKIFCRSISICIPANSISSDAVNAFRREAFVLPSSMKTTLNDLLNNRYQEHLLPYFYENCVRELFFLHLAGQGTPIETPLSPGDQKAVKEAERIIRENLQMHFSIQELARKTGTNEYKLKKDFRQVYKTGLFGHLLQLRMQYAAKLLETTSIPVKDIAEQTGYDTVAGFITAFRKHHGSPPREWRNRYKKS